MDQGDLVAVDFVRVVCVFVRVGGRRKPEGRRGHRHVHPRRVRINHANREQAVDAPRLHGGFGVGEREDWDGTCGRREPSRSLRRGGSPRASCGRWRCRACEARDVDDDSLAIIVGVFGVLGVLGVLGASASLASSSIAVAGAESTRMSSDLGATLGTMILSTPSMHDAEMLEASTAPPVGRRRSARTCGCFSRPHGEQAAFGLGDDGEILGTALPGGGDEVALVGLGHLGIEVGDVVGVHGVIGEDEAHEGVSMGHAERVGAPDSPPRSRAVERMRKRIGEDGVEGVERRGEERHVRVVDVGGGVEGRLWWSLAVGDGPRRRWLLRSVLRCCAQSS